MIYAQYIQILIKTTTFSYACIRVSMQVRTFSRQVCFQSTFCLPSRIAVWTSQTLLLSAVEEGLAMRD